VQPRDTDTVTHFKSSGTRTALRDSTHHFMPWHDPSPVYGKVAFDDVKIGPADATRVDSNEDFAFARLRLGAVDAGKRAPLDRRGMLERHDLHGPTMPKEPRSDKEAGNVTTRTG
jgi:hypothetical protein